MIPKAKSSTLMTVLLSALLLLISRGTHSQQVNHQADLLHTNDIIEHTGPLGLDAMNNNIETSPSLAIAPANGDASSLLEIDSRRKTQSECKYNLKSLSQYEIPYDRAYEIQRDRWHPGFNYGKGPLRYKRNSLPEAFIPECYPRRRYTLTILIRGVPAGYKMFAGSCVAYKGTNYVQFPTVQLFDCNGNPVGNCSEPYNYYQANNGAIKQDLLAVAMPESNRRTIGYKFFYRHTRQSSIWCDWYPF